MLNILGTCKSEQHKAISGRPHAYNTDCVQWKPEDLLTRYKRALEGLTPGGSEFVNEPERCAQSVRDGIESKWRVLKSHARRIHELQAELARKDQEYGENE